MRTYMAWLLFAVAGAAACPANQELAANAFLIATVTNKVGATVSNMFMESESILGILETLPDFKRLAEMSRTDWNLTLERLSVVAPDRTSRLVLFHSYLFLPPKQYMECLERLADKLQSGKLNQDEFVFIFLLSPREECHWFLSYNAENPRVVKLLAKLRTNLANNANWVSTIDFIRTGKAKVRDELLRNEHPTRPKKNIPLLPES